MPTGTNSTSCPAKQNPNIPFLPTDSWGILALIRSELSAGRAGACGSGDSVFAFRGSGAYRVGMRWLKLTSLRKGLTRERFSTFFSDMPFFTWRSFVCQVQGVASGNSLADVIECVCEIFLNIVW